MTAIRSSFLYIIVRVKETRSYGGAFLLESITEECIITTMSRKPFSNRIGSKTPVTVLEHAISIGLFKRSHFVPQHKRNNWGTPGEIVKALPEGDRTLLAELKAEDTWNFRDDSGWAWYCEVNKGHARWEQDRVWRDGGFDTPLARLIHHKATRGY